MVNATI